MADIGVGLTATDRTAPATNSAARNLKKVGKSAKKTRSALESLIRSFVGVAAAAAGVRRAARFYTDSTKIFMEFEQQIKDVGLISNSTASEFELLSDKAKELGETTQFTAIQSAEAMKEFARAGFTAAETTNTIGVALEFAAATGAGLTQASEAMVATIKSYGLTAKESAGLSDLFASAINNSRFTVTSLNEALKFGAPAGAAFEQSTEDMTAALAALVDVTGQGSIAGTAYRMMLAKSANVGDEAKEVLSRYGLTVSAINPKLNSMGQVFKTLAEVGLDAGDAIKIFGVRSGPAIASVAKRIREGKLDWDEYADSVTKSTDAAEQAIQRLDTLQGSVTLLSSAFEGLQLAVGERAAPALTDAARGLTDIVKLTNAAEKETTSFTDKIWILGSVLAAQGEVYNKWLFGTKTEEDLRIERVKKMLVAEREMNELFKKRVKLAGTGERFNELSILGGRVTGPAANDDIEAFSKFGRRKPGAKGKGKGKGTVSKISREVDALKLMVGEIELVMAAEEAMFVSFEEHSDSAADALREFADEEARFLDRLTESSRASTDITRREIQNIEELRQAAKQVAAESKRELDATKQAADQFRDQMAAVGISAGSVLMKGLISGIRGEKDAFKQTLKGLIPLVFQAVGLATGQPGLGAIGGALAGAFHQGGITRAHTGLITSRLHPSPGEQDVRVLSGEAFLNRDATQRLGEEGVDRLNAGAEAGGQSIVINVNAMDGPSVAASFRHGEAGDALRQVFKRNLLGGAF